MSEMFVGQITEMAASSPALDSSFIVVADVRGSTSAILRGQQREVNVVGAACIAAVRNNFPPGDIPYVFGGDGATFLVPAEQLTKLKDVLEAVQTMARVHFKLSLRVGEIRVSEIRAMGADISVRDLACGAEEKLFFLQGNGVALAERTIKERDSHFDEISSLLGYSKINMDGLSCRLLPFKSLRGSVYCFIIESMLSPGEQEQLFRRLFSVLTKDGELDRFRPLQKLNTRRSWLPKSWLIEARLFTTMAGIWGRIKRYFKSLKENILTTFVFRYNVVNDMTGLPSVYMDEVLIQSDWIKFNGSLYLILDMSPPEYSIFISELDLHEQKGALIYGVQKASSALVVCHLDSSSQKRHFHFVDGSDGGLTLAALQLKEKRRL